MPPSFKALTIGDPAPFFRARTGGHTNFPFETVGGRYVVLSFFGTIRTPASQKAADHILTHRAWFDDKTACFFGVSIEPSDETEGLLRDSMPGVRYFRDFDQAVSRLYGIAAADRDYRPMTLVLDPMMRVRAAIAIDADHNAQFDRVIAALPTLEEDADSPYGAPVLLLPRVFEEDFCAHLIAQYEAHGGSASGFMQDAGEQSVEVLEARYKKRHDFHITDPGLQSQIQDRLGRRIVPAIARVFQFHATRIERFLVACYEAESGGFFSAHRDNTTLATSHRRFAATINLNSDYDGGDLVFPEFGPRSYRAPVGGAVIFSCSLLHEATIVRRGRRFAFLPFLHDEAAEVVSQQNKKFFSGKVVDRD